jgi:hypothetical protein
VERTNLRIKGKTSPNIFQWLEDCEKWLVKMLRSCRSILLIKNDPTYVDWP